MRRASICPRRFLRERARSANMPVMSIIYILVVAAILLLAYGVYLQVTGRRTSLAERLETYASIEEEAARTTDEELQKLGQLPRFLHMVFGPGYMAQVEENLARADIPMRPAEYLLLRVVLVGRSEEHTSELQ